MSSLTIVQAGIFLSYITFLMVKFKGPIHSISESWYLLPGLQKSLFTWFCFSVGFLMFFQTNGLFPSLFFLSGAGLCFVGAATMFKLKQSIEPYIHFGGAAICILAALLGIGLEKEMWLPLIYFIVFTLGLSIFKINNKTWWIEILAFALIELGLYY